MWSQNQTGIICEDINTADASILQRVNGIGRTKAQAIIDYRNQHGPFQSLDELRNVRGIGSATIENFREAGFCVQLAAGTAEIERSQSSSAGHNSNATVNSCDNVNTANASVLQRVKGIGRTKAQAIIDYRNQQGSFQSLDELRNVRGIGQATIENFREAGFCVQEAAGTTEIERSQSNSAGHNSNATVNNCVNVNTANASDLQRVSRIGAVRARAIIDYRNEHGPFQSLGELTRVRGIGAATVENFRRAGFCVKASSETRNYPATPTQTSSTNSTTTNANCYNINTANTATLQRVRGIGPVKAQAITDYRNQYGPFRSLDELTRV